MPTGIASPKTQAEEQQTKRERQLIYALVSYDRNKTSAVKSLVAYKSAKTKSDKVKHLKDARDKIDLAQLARSVALRHGHDLPALPEIPAPRRSA